MIRDVQLPEKCYENMLRFFLSSAWYFAKLKARWIAVVCQHAPLYRVQDAVVLIGDGVKQAKEGRHMPGVQRLHQKTRPKRHIFLVTYLVGSECYCRQKTISVFALVYDDPR